MIKKAAVSLVLLFSIAAGIFIALAFHAVTFISPWGITASLTSLDEVSATAWAIFDVETGEVLVGENTDTTYPLASVTKLFLAEEILRQPNTFDSTIITWGDLATYGDAGSLTYGQEISFYTLLFPLLLSSSNDAAAALERNFPDLLSDLNEEFSNKGFSVYLAEGSGLSDQNVSSVKDLSMISADLYQTSTHLLSITKLPYRAVDEGAWQNNSPVADMKGYEGGKHGYTDVAGHTIVSFFQEESLLGEDRVLGYILLGSDDLKNDIEILRNYANLKLLWF